MFYFAAASFSEFARLEDLPDRPTRFLCADHPTFGPATRALSPLRTDLRGARYAAAVEEAVKPLNLVGLCDATKRNWYAAIPVSHDVFL